MSDIPSNFLIVACFDFYTYRNKLVPNLHTCLWWIFKQIMTWTVYNSLGIDVILEAAHSVFGSLHTRISPNYEKKMQLYQWWIFSNICYAVVFKILHNAALVSHYFTVSHCRHICSRYGITLQDAWKSISWFASTYFPERQGTRYTVVMISWSHILIVVCTETG